MSDAFICDIIRTPFGRYGGALSSVRTDDLAAIPLKALIERNSSVDWSAVDDVILGCANQAGEDNRNVARMALLLAGVPQTVPGTTVNRLCGSSMDAVSAAARAIKTGENSLVIAGGVESMSRAPFVMAKSDAAFSRGLKVEDSTIGWRFVNPLMKPQYGVDSMAETAENVAEEFHISRQDQDAFAYRSQQRTAAAIKSGALAALKPIVKANGTITAGNASGINDGACALLLASEQAVKRYSLTPKARVVASAAVGVAPRIMGMGPAPATRKALALTNLSIADMDVIELNEAFAAQTLAVLRDLGIADDAAHVNPNGGAIAIGHPLGASGGRLVATAVLQLHRTGGRYALCTMCIGVGQGIAMILERV